MQINRREMKIMFNQYDDILSVYDVADILYLGKNRVYELLEEGKLKGFRIGRIWKIPKESLEMYVRESTGLTKK